MKTNTILLSIATVLALGGCASSTRQAALAEPTTEQTAAMDALRVTYSQGKYGDVIREVARSNVLATAPTDVVVESMKLQAFSYCLTGHASLCTDQFARILAIRPTFDLEGAEQGHPQWQRAFDQARAMTPASAAASTSRR